jgi:non-heme chloroperoxidase
MRMSLEDPRYTQRGERRAALVLGAALIGLPGTGPAALERDVLVASAPEVQLHVIEAGARTRRPALLLIPGWTIPASIWSEQIDVFARERRVVAVDPRSQGKSTKTAEGDTPEQRARDLHSVIQRLELTPLVIVAWSQGVQDVAAYVDQFGTQGIRAFVLVDSTVSAGAAAIPAAPERAARQLSRLDSYLQDPRAYTRGFLRTIITKPMSEAELTRWAEEAMQTPPAIGAAMLIADLFGPDRTPALARIDRPTLVIASAASPELEAEKAMAAQLPDGHVEVVEGAGHAVFVDQPVRFDELLRQFLNSVQ